MSQPKIVGVAYDGGSNKALQSLQLGEDYHVLPPGQEFTDEHRDVVASAELAIWCPSAFMAARAGEVELVESASRLVVFEDVPWAGLRPAIRECIGNIEEVLIAAPLTEEVKERYRAFGYECPLTHCGTPPHWAPIARSFLSSAPEVIRKKMWVKLPEEGATRPLEESDRTALLVGNKDPVNNNDMIGRLMRSAADPVFARWEFVPHPRIHPGESKDRLAKENLEEYARLLDIRKELLSGVSLLEYDEGLSMPALIRAFNVVLAAGGSTDLYVAAYLGGLITNVVYYADDYVIKRNLELGAVGGLPPFVHLGACHVAHNEQELIRAMVAAADPDSLESRAVRRAQLAHFPTPVSFDTGELFRGHLQS